MRIGYFDCFCGAAGDMILGALMDAGCPLEFLRQIVAQLELPGVGLSAEKVDRGGIAATHVTVSVDPQARQRHRHLPEILNLLDTAKLPSSVAAQAASIFRRLARAEATVHGVAIEKVHFHEVGAADAIVDVVGACAGISRLGVEQIACSSIPTGHGTVRCDHGVMPIPAPATTLLLQGVPLAACDEPGELTTPTGAAILTTLASQFGPLPAMRLDSAGYGAGTRPGQTRPNFLRLLIGESGSRESEEADLVSVLEAQVDDATGQSVAHAAERLLDAGALDVSIVPIIMKKGRPGQVLTVVCRPDDVPMLESVIFRESTTFGIRRHTCERTRLAREHMPVSTRFGPIRIKIGRRGNEMVRAWPEYEDCAAAARRAGVSLLEVQRAALQTWEQSSTGRPSG